MTKDALIEHLYNRGCTDKFRIFLGEETATFLLWNFAGQLKGYQRYTPNAPKNHKNPKEARYFTRSSEPCLWGLDHLPKNINTPVFVTESIFKAMALINSGYNAVSSLGSNIPKSLLRQMKLSRIDWICIGDNDKAGLKFSRTFLIGATSPDLDELSRLEVITLANSLLGEYDGR